MSGTLAPGFLLNSRYRILDAVGAGGMGAVYKAADTRLGGRTVALKEMSEDGLSPQEVAEAANSFQQEAHLLAGLQHPSLPSIHDYFSVGGRWYLVMEFIQGVTLEDYLLRHGTPGLPVNEVMSLAQQLCAVLEYLHGHQPPIIFRDLKPSNIMVTASSRVHLIDFGIARLFKPGQAHDTIAFGSMGYAAPEQYGKCQTTEQSDIYSLGATLYQLLTGVDPAVRPFTFPAMQPLNPHIPPKLATLVMSMVQLDQSKRPPSVSWIQEELHRIASQPSMQQPTTSSPGTPAPLLAASDATQASPYQPQHGEFTGPPTYTPPDYGSTATPSANVSMSPTLPKSIARRSAISYPKLLLFTILGQLATIAWLVLIFTDAPNGAALWKSSSLVNNLSIFVFLFGFIDIIACATYALIKIGMLRRWGWFVAVLLGTLVGSVVVPAIALIVFGLIGPTVPDASHT